jgi:hypothetical protein
MYPAINFVINLPFFAFILLRQQYSKGIAKRKQNNSKKIFFI